MAQPQEPLPAGAVQQPSQKHEVRSAGLCTCGTRRAETDRIPFQGAGSLHMSTLPIRLGSPRAFPPSHDARTLDGFAHIRFFCVSTGKIPIVFCLVNCNSLLVSHFY